MKKSMIILVMLAAQARAYEALQGPAASLSLILGRPTDRSITLSVLSAADVDACVEYSTDFGKSTATTDLRTLKAGIPSEFELNALKPDTRYEYRLVGLGTKPLTAGTFHTQRATGSAFTFALQGDSHPERQGKMFDSALYTQTLHNVVKDRPDFYITMGDDFSIERLIQRHTLSQSTVDQVYARQREFLGLAGSSSALFLVNGNHEQAALCAYDGTPGCAAVLAGLARLRYFPLPAPGPFYTGNTQQLAHAGSPRDYYAWTWGDALFVVIDFYWHSSGAVANEPGEEGGAPAPGAGRERKRDLWNITLGETQYRWLSSTLTSSKSRWKFIFCHHVLGTGRGGVEMARLGEWGGRERSGNDLFAERRPGWALPIHPLLVKTGVTIFFQGHDHLFARQELDGVVYQSCPNPADPTFQAFNREAYLSGDILPNSGYLRLAVSAQEVGVDYVRSWLAQDETNVRKNGETAFHYTIRKKEPAP